MFRWLESLRTPCPRPARRMGYVREALGIQTRFRRVGDHWREHIDRCHALIRDGIERCPRRRTAAVLGAGLVHDVPLEELSRYFERVLLVDICHPPASRRLHRHQANVEPVLADVTETIEALFRLPHPHEPFICPLPKLFADRDDIDLTVSLNLLSQLPCMPMDHLSRWGYERRWVEAYARGVIARHLEWLRGLPGVKVLVTDIERIQLKLSNEEVERIDLLFGEPAPLHDAEWTWKLAPCPEASREFHYYRRVIGAVTAT